MASSTHSKRRRRRLGTKRTPEADLGTPEARAHKLALVGSADPALAEYPLGVLLARGILTPEQHDAGCHYAYLAGRVLGRTKPYRADLGGGGGEALTEGALAAVEFGQARTTLKDRKKEVGDGLLRKMLNDLGLTKADLDL